MLHKILMCVILLTHVVTLLLYMMISDATLNLDDCVYSDPFVQFNKCCAWSWKNDGPARKKLDVEVRMNRGF